MSVVRFIQVSVVGAVCSVGAYGARAAALPVFTYDPASGVLHMDADLDSGATVVSWLIDGPQASQVLAYQNGTASQGSEWV